MRNQKTPTEGLEAIEKIAKNEKELHRRMKQETIPAGGIEAADEALLSEKQTKPVGHEAVTEEKKDPPKEDVPPEEVPPELLEEARQDVEAASVTPKASVMRKIEGQGTPPEANAKPEKKPSTTAKAQVINKPKKPLWKKALEGAGILKRRK